MKHPHPERNEFQGYHQFIDEDGKLYGSFEVDYLTPREGAGDPPNGAGWYWVACFPGCLPDGEPSGPFPTAEGAYLDAIGD